MAEFDVRTSSIDTPVGTLSGGNQQKVILAREVGREVRLLLASQPTRGLDVGSIEFVHRRIVEERDQGVAVIIVSSELDEIYALADRIAVMYEGKITGFRPPTVPVAELGLLMAGRRTRPARPPAMPRAPARTASGAATEAATRRSASAPVMTTDPGTTSRPAQDRAGRPATAAAGEASRQPTRPAGRPGRAGGADMSDASGPPRPRPAARAGPAPVSTQAPSRRGSEPPRARA